MRERLQKIIARGGLASRRHAETLILTGEVRVNGQVITQLGAKADPAADVIEVSGRRLRLPVEHLYLLLNKPRGYVSTAADPKGRRTVFHLLKGIRQRVFTVGRLPYDVEGLLLLTSDGAWADALLRGRLPQTYWFKIKGALSEAECERLGRMAGRQQPEPQPVRRVKAGPNPWYEVTLVEPRGDWFRTALFRLGHPVEKVRRVALGSLRDPALAPGHFRPLTDKEVERLRREACPAGKTAFAPAAGKARPRQVGLPPPARRAGKRQAS
ncbi:MAG: rRNA pseudouridine synthase [Acidobacteria bacterium]|nr:rRNA pseudouridine synthase [Acidobacteriota bacterium]